MRKKLKINAVLLTIVLGANVASAIDHASLGKNENNESEKDELTADVTAGIKQQSPEVLVEEFTADTLANNEWKIGSDLEFGASDNLMLGTDMGSLLVGVPSLHFKYYAFHKGKHHVAVGLRLGYFDKKTFLWGSGADQWETLSGEVYRPSVSWTHKLSNRLKLHTFWAKGLGKISAKLSDEGKQKLCESKYPDADCEEITTSTTSDSEDIEDTIDDDDIGQDDDSDGQVDDLDTSKNLESTGSDSSPFSRSIPVQSITGFAQDRFQITGEINRTNGNKVLVTARIEQTTLEELDSNFFRLTMAHQWIWNTFQMRVGIGTQYYVMTGRDLDGVKVDDSGVQPASDIAFYWRF
jgi:hypothetical protein